MGFFEVHIIENYNAQAKRVYCYVAECIWDKNHKKYVKPRVPVGHLEGSPSMFVPNKTFAALLQSDKDNHITAGERERAMIDTVKSKYGNNIDLTLKRPARTKVQTAKAIFLGPSIVFGGITSRYNIDTILIKAFGYDITQEILSMAWYLACEGDALVNSNVWLGHFENPVGQPISSQDITRLLDSIKYDGIMTFYKHWLEGFKKTGDKVFYDLTSISSYCRNIDMVNWGHNRDKEALPQVNFALLCIRKTAMPLFAWPLNGSVTDVRTLHNTLEFLDKLNYKPDCLMMDRGFASIKNITDLLRQKHTFLQALNLDANWIRTIIDAGRQARLRPDSMIKVDERTYYGSTSMCQWVIAKLNKPKKTEKESPEEAFIYQCKDSKHDKYTAKDTEEIIAQYPCVVHVLFCQDLVGNQWDRFMEKLNHEYERLLADANAEPSKGLKNYFFIEKKKWAKNRTVDFNMEQITKHRNNYAGHLCFITNDKTINSSSGALQEYSTRDYIEKDFDEMKNDLDMRRIRVHNDERMKARLFIQFIAEIYLREIRVRLHDSDICKKLTRKQIFSHIKSIYKIKFIHKYNDIIPELSKIQRAILEALGFSAFR